MAYALFREAVRNDMEIKFGSAEGLQKAIERQRDKAIKDQLVEAAKQGEELSAEELSELSQDIQGRLIESVIARMWHDAEPSEREGFLNEETKAAGPKTHISKPTHAAAATDDDGNGDDDGDESDVPIGHARQRKSKHKSKASAERGSASRNTLEKERKKASSKEKSQKTLRKGASARESTSRYSSPGSEADARTSAREQAKSGEKENRARKSEDDTVFKLSSVSSKAASKRKSAGTRTTESKRQAASAMGAQTRTKDPPTSKGRRRQSAPAKASSKGKGRASGGRDEKEGDSKRDKELAALLAGFGLQHGEKEWIQVEWAVQKTGKDANEWMQWFNAAVDLRKPVGVDEDDRPKWPIHYSRCGTLKATKSKVSFVNQEHLLDDFDSEPMNWRKKHDDLETVVPQLKRSSSMAGSTSSSSGADREAEWRDDYGTKPRSRR